VTGKRLHWVLLGGCAFSALLLATNANVVFAISWPCVLRTYFAVNCPFCGMTRDFCAMAHGEFTALHNPCSPLMAVTIFGVYPVAAIRYLAFGNGLEIGYAARRDVLVVALSIMWLLNNLR